MVANLPQANDAVAIAGQLGRFDFASLLLTVIALLIAVLALPVFSYLQFRAKQAAIDEVKKVTEGLHAAVEREAVSKMEALLPTLVEQYYEIARNSVTDQVADDIADAQDEIIDDHDLSGDQGGAGNRA